MQAAWEVNHRKFGATRLGQLLTMPIAIRSLFDGMIQGMFTGKKLESYFDASTDDAEGARRIVTGLTRRRSLAVTIATFSRLWRQRTNAASTRRFGH
ncbi:MULTISPECIES: hypothetical protein [unclassified Rhizobium]|uniref:hypothetical protein n=1 Tax=unclassified Rhizobium TaxID=2613769 RepID=UPI0006F84388|nr:MULTISPECIES: hypothetical protein [unclassified Rhizobium]KQV39164.1 hypothetical protein ASC86_23135 [Rhizobium sp. Root1212]KRD35138.1 hypothetical protein ASE37_21705 [Rhizobium sp. Root268]